MNSPTKKEETMANQEQYRAVLEDLFKQRNLLQFKIGEIDAAIAALGKLMPSEQIAEPKPAPAQQVFAGMPGKYTGMGVRSAVLNLLSEDAMAPMGATEIAKALRAGGLSTTGKNFRGNVSAVISDMSRKRGEVEAGPDGGWKITQKGKDVWAQIKASRTASFPTVSGQPAVQ